MRFHLAERGEEEPFATGSSAQRLFRRTCLATAIGQSFPSGKQAVTVLADTRLPGLKQRAMGGTVPPIRGQRRNTGMAQRELRVCLSALGAPRSIHRAERMTAPPPL